MTIHELEKELAELADALLFAEREKTELRIEIIELNKQVAKLQAEIAKAAEVKAPATLTVQKEG